MMNEARFGVGVQGIGIGERAYQQALAFAKERVQGRDAVTGAVGIPIINHPDVKRMLLTMRARIMAARALAYTAAGWFDLARHSPDKAAADKAKALRRPADAGGQGLEHRAVPAGLLRRDPGAWRHGLRRGDRHRPALPRCAHHHHLRRHHRHPGQRPGRAQGAARERRHAARTDRRNARRRRRLAAVTESLRPLAGGSKKTLPRWNARWTGSSPTARTPGRRAGRRRTLPAPAGHRLRRLATGARRARRDESRHRRTPSPPTTCAAWSNSRSSTPTPSACRPRPVSRNSRRGDTVSASEFALA
jgi:hypothetical protein